MNTVRDQVHFCAGLCAALWVKSILNTAADQRRAKLFKKGLVLGYILIPTAVSMTVEER